MYLYSIVAVCGLFVYILTWELSKWMFLMLTQKRRISAHHAHCECLNGYETIFWLYWCILLYFWIHLVRNILLVFLFSFRQKLPKLTSNKRNASTAATANAVVVDDDVFVSPIWFTCTLSHIFLFKCESALCVFLFSAFVMCLPCAHCLPFLDWFESSDSCVSHSDLVVTCFCEICVCVYALCVSHVHILVFTATARSRVCLPHFFMSVWWWFWRWWRRRWWRRQMMMMMLMCVYFIQFISGLSSLNRILIHFWSNEFKRKRERKSQFAERNRYLFTQKSHKTRTRFFLWHGRCLRLSFPLSLPLFHIATTQQQIYGFVICNAGQKYCWIGLLLRANSNDGTDKNDNFCFGFSIISTSLNARTHLRCWIISSPNSQHAAFFHHHHHRFQSPISFHWYVFIILLL